MTVTDVVPKIDVLAAEAALTVSFAAVSLGETVSRPPESILVPAPPPETDHVTDCEGIPTVAVTVA